MAPAMLTPVSGAIIALYSLLGRGSHCAASSPAGSGGGAAETRWPGYPRSADRNSARCSGGAAPDGGGHTLSVAALLHCSIWAVRGSRARRVVTDACP